MKNITASLKDRQHEAKSLAGKDIRSRWNRRKTLVIWLVIAVVFLATVCIGGSFCSETPKLVIADEPTPGLDPKLARRAMEHFRKLADMGAAVLVITHDLELALQTVDRIQVFYAGYTIEDSPAEDFAKEETLRHPYTKALWRAMPGHGFHYIDGVQPYARDMQQGCPFAPRCGKCTDKCKEEVPWHQSGNGYVRCIYDT